MGRIIDLTGKTFGLWQIKGMASERKKGQIRWTCLCTGCNRVREVLGGNLRSGGSKGCSCCMRYHPYRDAPKNDITGTRFGIVVARKPVLKDNRWQWECHCDCGGIKIAQHHDLKNGKYRSCGCLKGKRGPDHHQWAGCGVIPGWYWRRIRLGAKARGIPVDITMEEISEVLEAQDHKCALSGMDISFSYGTISSARRGTTASLDRVDSSIGYVLSNIQWVHKDINHMKMDLGTDRFIELCQLVSNKERSNKANEAQ